MKNLILICALVFAVLATSAQEEKKTRKEKRAEREAMLIEQTKELAEAGEWQFDASRMLPARGKSRTLTTPYNVVVQNDEVDSYLPFFGVAYSADYGSSESPMIFKAPIENYTKEDGKKGGYVIKFQARNKSDLVQFTFSVSVTGSTTLSVNSTNRQHISYHGELVPVKKKE